jgi:hypothetical protein
MSEHLHERMAGRIAEMSEANRSSPEAVRCLLAEFAEADLHDWGCAFCISPYWRDNGGGVLPEDLINVVRDGFPAPHQTKSTTLVLSPQDCSPRLIGKGEPA